MSSTLLLALVNRILKVGHFTPGSATLFVVLCIMRLVAGITSGYMLIHITQQAIVDLRLTLCQSIMDAPLRHIEELGASRLWPCLNNDISDIAGVVINLPYFLVNIIIIASCICYLGWLSPRLLPLFIICIILGMVSYLLPVLSARRHYRRAREKQDSLYRHLRSLFDGAKELKLSSSKRTAFISELLEPTLVDVRRHNIKAANIYTSTANWNRLLFFLYVGLVLLVLPRFSPSGPGLAAAYVLAVLYIMAPLEAIMNSSPNVGRANIALSKIAATGLSLEKVKEKADVSPLQDANQWHLLRISRASYSYQRLADGSPFHLGPVDLEVRPGQIVFIVGGNGSGKTTLGKLISGLYIPTEGEIWIDNIQVNECNSRSYRELFSAVFSDYHLFEHLVGIPASAIDDHATRLLERLELDRKVQVRNGIFSTTDLSQGQRKRLALIAALLEDRPIYLFDEWAADQDPEFREVFYREILPDLARRGKTLLVITHDDRYFHLADVLVKLECGKVIAVDDNSKLRASTRALGTIPTAL